MKLMRNECISRSKFLLGQTVWCNYRYFIFKKIRKSAYYPRIIGESVVFGHWDHRPLFLATKSSRSQLRTSSKLDSGRLELYTKSLRNFNKKYAFRPEPNLELFQVQIRTDLYNVYCYIDKKYVRPYNDQYI